MTANTLRQTVEARPSLLLRTYGVFAAAFFVHLAFSAWLYPTLLSANELWAEIGPNFLFHAYYSDLKTNIGMRDFAYYPLFVRLVTLSVWACGVPLRHAGFVLQLFGWLFVNLCNVSFCLPYFRRFIKADSIRFVVCLALLVHDSYFVRLPINILYPAFVPFCFLVADLAYVATWRPGHKIFLWAVMALIVPSKPLYIATIPSFAFHTANGCRQRNKSLCLLATSLLLVGIVALSLINTQGVGGARGLPLLRLIGLTTRWTMNVCLSALGGRSYLFFLDQQIASFADWSRCWRWLLAQPLLLLVFAFAPFAALCSLARSLMRRLPLPMMSMAFHFFLIAGGCVAMACASSQFPIPHSIAEFYRREWYPPAILVFFVCSVVVAHGHRTRLTACAALVPWMIASFPFGLSPLPQEPSWPCVKRSSWQAVASAPQLVTTGRVCATLNPIPWMFTAPYCSPLYGPATPLQWGSLSKFRDRQRGYIFALPRHITNQEVDSVTMMLRSKESQQIQLILRDASGDVIAAASATVSPTDELTPFIFDGPVRAACTAELTSKHISAVGVAMFDQQRHQPSWFWFGRG